MPKPRIIRLPDNIRRKNVETGVYHNENFYKITVNTDTDCYVGNKLVFCFRKNAIDNQYWLPFIKKHLQKPILTSDKRKTAGASKTKKRVLVNSGIIGFYDRLTPDMKKQLGVHKAGRSTAYNWHYPIEWDMVSPLFRILDKWYKKTSPEYYHILYKQAKKVEPALLIKGTSFSTVTVNRDWRSATHRDSGNLSSAPSVIAVLGENFTGGGLGFPEIGVVVSMEPGDVILLDGHEPHGNTQLYIRKGGCRFSLVCYLREDMKLFHTPIVVKDRTFYLE